MAQTHAELNRAAWNAHAKSYDDEGWKRKIAEQLAQAVDQHADWIGAQWSKAGREECSMLDYACGTGAMTRAFASRITSAKGIDLSENMVDVYNARLSEVQSIQASAIVGDLVKDDPTSRPDDVAYTNFDFAVVGLGFHHFDDPKLCLERLGERLKPQSGVCLIIDWLPNEGGGHGHHHHHHHHKHEHHQAADVPESERQRKATIKHDGFDESKMRELFESAGFEDFGFLVLPEPLVLQFSAGPVERKAFLARGRRR